MIKTLYTAHAHATGGRTGKAASDDNKLQLTLSTPRDDGKGFGISAALSVHIPGMDKAKVEALARKAEIVCPYAHATRGNITSSFKVA